MSRPPVRKTENVKTAPVTGVIGGVFGRMRGEKAGAFRWGTARRAPRRSRGRRPEAAETVRRTVCPAGAGPVGAGGGRGERAGRRPGGAAADTGGARVFRRSRNGLRPPAGPLHKKAAHRLPLSRARAPQMRFQITFCFSHFPVKYRGR